MLCSPALAYAPAVLTFCFWDDGERTPFKGSKSRLTDKQKAELTRIIAAGPQQAGLDTGVWTTPIIVKLVRDLFGVSYDPDHMGKILHCSGLSAQCPGRNSSKADEKAQQTWRLEKLPVNKKTEKERGVTLYQDEAVFQLAGTVIRTWAPVGA